MRPKLLPIATPSTNSASIEDLSESIAQSDIFNSVQDAPRDIITSAAQVSTAAAQTAETAANTATETAGGFWNNVLPWKRNAQKTAQETIATAQDAPMTLTEQGSTTAAELSDARTRIKTSAAGLRNLSIADLRSDAQTDDLPEVLIVKRNGEMDVPELRTSAASLPDVPLAPVRTVGDISAEIPNDGGTFTAAQLIPSEDINPASLPNVEIPSTVAAKLPDVDIAPRRASPLPYYLPPPPALDGNTVIRSIENANAANRSIEDEFNALAEQALSARNMPRDTMIDNAPRPTITPPTINAPTAITPAIIEPRFEASALNAPAVQAPVITPPVIQQREMPVAPANAGNVDVAEAIRVPLTNIDVPQTIEPKEPPKMVLKRPTTRPQPTGVLGQLKGYPSQATNDQKLWAQISYFTTQKDALGFWDNYKNAHNLPPLRVRVTQPYALQSSGKSRVSLRVGPFKGRGEVARICNSLRNPKLRCTSINDVGSSATAGTSRYRPYEQQRYTSRYKNRYNGITAEAANGTHNALQKPNQSWVQLGAFRSPDQAEAAWKGLVSRYPGKLKSLQHRVEMPAMGSNRNALFRLRAGPYANAVQARNLCASLRSAGQACLVVRN